MERKEEHKITLSQEISDQTELLHNQEQICLSLFADYFERDWRGNKKIEDIREKYELYFGEAYSSRMAGRIEKTGANFNDFTESINLIFYGIKFWERVQKLFQTCFVKGIKDLEISDEASKKILIKNSDIRSLTRVSSKVLNCLFFDMLTIPYSGFWKILVNCRLADKLEFFNTKISKIKANKTFARSKLTWRIPKLFLIHVMLDTKSKEEKIQKAKIIISDLVSANNNQNIDHFEVADTCPAEEFGQYGYEADELSTEEWEEILQEFDIVEKKYNEEFGMTDFKINFSAPQ